MKELAPLCEVKNLDVLDYGINPITLSVVALVNFVLDVAHEAEEQGLDFESKMTAVIYEQIFNLQEYKNESN